MDSKPVIFGKRGRTTIPLPLRRRLGWQAGDTIRFRLDGDRVVISRVVPCSNAQAVPGMPTPAAAAPDLVKLLAQLVFALTGGGGSG